MPCFFCICAIGIAATLIVPALVDRLDSQLRTAADDLRNVKETNSIVMWTGTFSFVTPTGLRKQAATNVTIYKASKRARIQVLTHELPHDEVHCLQDVIANLLGATVLDRVDGTGEADEQRTAPLTESSTPEQLPPTPLPGTSEPGRLGG
jgi:hypothetical protein